MAPSRWAAAPDASILHEPTDLLLPLTLLPAALREVLLRSPTPPFGLRLSWYARQRKIRTQAFRRKSFACGWNSTPSSSGNMGRGQRVWPRLFRLALVAPGASTLRSFAAQAL